MSGKSQTVLNMGSYNYLGFAQNSGPCADYVEEQLPKAGCGMSSSRHELGGCLMLIYKCLNFDCTSSRFTVLFLKRYITSTFSSMSFSCAQAILG